MKQTWSKLRAHVVHVVGQKISNLILSEFCQISTEVDNFCRAYNHDDRIMWNALIFHLI